MHVSFPLDADRWLLTADFFQRLRWPYPRLLPLDCRWGLGGDVVDDAVDAAHLVDDPARDRRQRLVGEPSPVRRHRVDGVHAADGAGVLVGALVAHHPHRAARQQHREGLPDVTVAGQLAHFLLDAAVRLLQKPHLLARHLAEDAHAEPRTGKRLAVEERGIHAEKPTHRAHLVLEEVAERLDELELEVGRQPADVVVALDGLRWAAGRAGALDDVGVDRALREEPAVAELEPLRRAGDVEVEAELPREHRLHLLDLAVAEEPVVHEDAVEPLADRTVEQHGDDRGVHAAGEAEDDVLVADPPAQVLDRALYPLAHVPVGTAGADPEEEVADDPLAELGVHDLGMELKRVEPARLVARRGIRAVRAHRRRPEALRQPLDPVAPDDRRLGDAGEERAGAVRLQLRLAVLARGAGHDTAAESLGHDLHPVADPEHRHTEIEHRGVDGRSAIGEHAVRAAGKDYARRQVRAEALGGRRERDDLGIDVLLADAARDEVRVLRAVVENDDALANFLHCFLS